MLRGQGSLKELLGQDVVASSYARKKRLRQAHDSGPKELPDLGARVSGASEKKRKLQRFQPATSPREAKPLPSWVTPKRKTSSSPAVKSEEAFSSKPPEATPNGVHNLPDDRRSGVLHRQVLSTRAEDTASVPNTCPMCARVLGNDDELINNHIDNCLTKSAIGKKGKQRSLSAAFASVVTAATRHCDEARTSVQEQQAPAASVAPSYGCDAAGYTSQLCSLPLNQERAPLLHADLGEHESWCATPEAVGLTPRTPTTHITAFKLDRSTNFFHSTDAPLHPRPAGHESSAVASALTKAGADDAAVSVTADSKIEEPLDSSMQSKSTTGGTLATIESFTACVVGRRFQPKAECFDGEAVTFQHEASNVRDKNALLVVGSKGQVMGHLPAGVAKWLAPLVIGSLIDAAGCVLEDPTAPGAPTTIAVQVGFPPDMLLLSQQQQRRVRESLQQAADAAADNLTRLGRRLGPGGSGECLRSNFQIVMETVRSHDGHLLDPCELQLMTTFEKQPHSAQCLFLRLYQRSGPWFRQGTLSYPEVGDTGSAVRCLQAAGLLRAPIIKDHMVLIQMLTVPELKALAARISSPLSGRDAAGRESVLAWFRRAVASDAQLLQEGQISQEGLLEALLQQAGKCCTLTSEARLLMTRVRRLFFMSERQDLSRFLVTDLGITRYPEYRLNRPTSGFATRQHMLQYEAALMDAARLDAAFEDGDLPAAEAALIPAWSCLDSSGHKEAALSNTAAAMGGQPYLRAYTAAWVYVTMATAGVSLMEKKRRYGDATEILRQLLGGVCCSERRGEWWSRLSINTEHLGRPLEALEVAEAALADECVKTGDRLSLQRRVLRLGKPPRRWRRPQWATAALWEPPVLTLTGRPLESIVGMKSRFMGLDGEMCSVEEYALQHYATPEHGGWTGLHCEGGVWATLFGLLFWSVLFADVAGVFRTRFQCAPLDQGTNSFASSRGELIDARLQQIREGGGEDLLRRCWEANEGVMCRGVSWDRQPLEQLLDIVRCVGNTGLAALCRLLAEDQSGWSGGMPDLLLWRTDDCSAKLSEIKGPRDRLSDQQRAWAVALNSAGLQVEVCKVIEPKAVPQRRKSRV